MIQTTPRNRINVDLGRPAIFDSEYRKKMLIEVDTLADSALSELPKNEGLRRALDECGDRSEGLQTLLEEVRRIATRDFKWTMLAFHDACNRVTEFVYDALVLPQQRVQM